MKSDAALAKQYRFAFFGALCLLFWALCVQGQGSFVYDKPQKPGTPHLVDINHAGCAELTLLPGIGPGLAEKIIVSREKDGLFSTLSDLERVKGLGPAKVFKIANWILVDDQGRIPTVMRL